jgi:hypothetical protein
LKNPLEFFLRKYRKKLQKKYFLEKIFEDCQTTKIRRFDMNILSNKVPYFLLSYDEQECLRHAKQKGAKIKRAVPSGTSWVPYDGEFAYHQEYVYRVEIGQEDYVYYEAIGDSGKEACVCKMKDVPMGINLLPLKVFRLARKNEIPVQVPQGKDLVGILCSVSDIDLETAKLHAESFKDLELVIGYRDNAGYIDLDGSEWKYAYPVSRDITKHIWNPDK